MAQAPALGVGLVYSGTLAPLLESRPELVDVLEVEPQTHWLQPRPDAARYRADRETLARLAAFPQRKILHGIGNPVGGSRGPDRRQLGLFARTARFLDAAWASEHLSFNRAGAGEAFDTGFLLPPRQTEAGVAAAVAATRAFASALEIPFAFETGVNYLRPRADELSDGAFVRAVAEGADCAILLDLHNAWTNARNGRQALEDFLAEIPLERVLELHLAGGNERRGYWVDSHSGALPEPLHRLAEELVPRLPGLRAIVFEVFPSWVPSVGIERIAAELERLRALWDAGSEVRGAALVAPTLAPATPAARRTPAASAQGLADVQAWEDALGALVVGRSPATARAAELAGDPGVELTRELLGEFRASMIAATLPLTLRLCLLTLGPGEVTRLLEQHAERAPPEPFASSEAERFAEFLVELALDVPYLDDVLRYERAALRANLRGESVVVPFRHDPLVVLRSLGEGRLPSAPRAGAFEVELAV